MEQHFVIVVAQNPERVEADDNVALAELLVRAGEFEAHGEAARSVGGDGAEDRVRKELSSCGLIGVSAEDSRRGVGDRPDFLAALPGGEKRLKRLPRRPLGGDEVLVALAAREDRRERDYGTRGDEDRGCCDERPTPGHLPAPESALYVESRNTCTGSMPKTTYFASCGAPLSVIIRTVNTRPGEPSSGSSPRI